MLPAVLVDLTGDTKQKMPQFPFAVVAHYVRTDEYLAGNIGAWTRVA